LVDARAAIAIDPNNAQAYLALGSGQEMKGQISDALQSLQTAANLAAASNNTQLEALAKVRLATLMQSAPVFAPSPQPTK
jgi:hypothetical protein